MCHYERQRQGKSLRLVSLLTPHLSNKMGNGQSNTKGRANTQSLKKRKITQFSWEVFRPGVHFLLEVFIQKGLNRCVWFCFSEEVCLRTISTVTSPMFSALFESRNVLHWILHILLCFRSDILSDFYSSHIMSICLKVIGL